MTRERELVVLQACIHDLETAITADRDVSTVSPQRQRERQEQVACLRAELAQLTRETDGGE